MRSIADIYHDFFRPILGGRKYEDWQKESFQLQKVEIKNKKLALELEEECKKRGGFLTFAEYVQIEQFGKSGFHNTHFYHGFTPTFKTWADAIVQYVSGNDIHHIIEVGPGDGNLAHLLYKGFQKKDFRVQWTGVEILEKQRAVIENRFKDKKYAEFFGGVAQDLTALPYYNKALIISSFCIDSVPPEALINTKKASGIPDAAIGIKVEDGFLEEFILEKGQLKKKGMDLENGIFTKNGISYDVRAYRLSPMQRAYLTFDGFRLIYDAAKQVKHPTILVIDEVRDTIDVLRSDHILSPLYLSVKNRYKFNPHKAYERSGEVLYYYPFYLDSLLSMLRGMGLAVTEYDLEPKLAAKLSGKPWAPDPRVSRYLCYGILANGTLTKNNTFKLSFPRPQGL
ncbi:MAG: hypothetical protein ACM3IJ_04955 [Candidatus Levyibacteriota bacterium]